MWTERVLILCINSSWVSSHRPTRGFVCLPLLAWVQGSLWHSRTERDFSHPPSLTTIEFICCGRQGVTRAHVVLFLRGDRKALSPQWLKKICPWLDKRLTLCHVRSRYNEQTGSVHRWELCVSAKALLASLPPPPHTHVMSLPLQLIC